MRKTKRNLTAAVLVFAATLSATPVFAAKEKEESTSKANTESISKEASAKDNGERTIIDHAGNEVTLPEEINRIVVTDTLPLPSVLSLYLDSAEKLVGISPVSMSAAKAGLLGELYPEILDADTSFFENNELNIESLLALEPDLVFYNAQNKELGESLASAGLTAVAVSVTKWDYNAADTFDAWMDLLADIFPEEKEKAEAAKEYGEKVEEEIQDKTDELKDEEKKNVFFLFNYSDTALVTSGKNFWGQYWCDAINAVNVGEEIEAERSNASVNMEQVYSWDPKIIFISNFTKAMPEDLYNNTIGDNDWKAGFAAGAELQYQASSNLGVAVGALYSVQGFKAKDLKVAGMTFEGGKWNPGYINVPITLNYYPVAGLALKAGLQPGFLVNKDDAEHVNPHCSSLW